MKINIIPRNVDIQTLSEMVSAGSNLFFITHNKSVRLLSVTSLDHA